MGRRYGKDWDELARREPYFAVLTDERFLRTRLDGETRKRFFETGEADVDRLLALIREHTGREFAPESALDFGCGVGRLTLPLARRFERAVGCDISPLMVAEARENAAEAGLANVTFVTELDALSGQRFDLICSLIVFQHIPVREGLDTLSKLLTLLAPGGVAAIHFTLRRPGNAARRFARMLRGALPPLHRLVQRLSGDRLRLPYMQMNAYDEAEIVGRIVKATQCRPLVVPRMEGEVEGAVFVAERPPVAH